MRLLCMYVISVILFSNLESEAQVNYFDKAFNINGGWEFAWSVLLTDDSTYVTLSAGQDISNQNGYYNFSNFSAVGSLNLNKSYLHHQSSIYTGLSNSLFSLPSHEGYIFAGGIEDNISGNSDVLVVRFDENGDTIYEKKYGDISDYEGAYYSTLTNDLKVILVGIKGGVGDPKDILLMKLDTNGNLLWQKTYGSIEKNLAYSVFEIANLKYLIGGTKVYDQINANPWIIITDTAGNVLDDKEFTSPFYSCAISLTPALDGNYLVSTCVDTVIELGDYYRPSMIGKIDTGLDFIWQTIYNYPLSNGLYITKQIQDSCIVFIGYQEGGNPNGAEGWIGKLDKAGNKLWEHQYRHSNSTFNYFSDFQQTYDGGFIITGSTIGSTGQDVWLVKLDSMGCLEPCFTNAGTIETGDAVASLQCFPNPARLQTSILYNIPINASEASLMIYDLSEKILSHFPLDRFGNHSELNLSSWSPGIYFCSLIIDGSSSKTVKLLIQ